LYLRNKLKGAYVLEQRKLEIERGFLWQVMVRNTLAALV